MLGLLEFVFFLYSFADTMIAALVKPFVIERVTLEMTICRTNDSVPNSGPGNETSWMNITSLQTAALQLKTDALQLHADRTTSALSYTESPFNSTALPVVDGKGWTIDAEDYHAIQKRIAYVMILDLCCVFLPGVLMGMCCGAWSDKHGRKPTLLIPPLGHVASTVVYFLTPHCTDYLLLLVLASALWRGVFGKGAVFATAVCSMVTDIEPPERRSVRFSSLMTWRFAGICLGSVFAGVMNDAVGVIYSMMTSSALQLLCALVCACFVHETLEKKVKEKKEKEKREKEKEKVNDAEATEQTQILQEAEDSSSGQASYTTLQDVFRQTHRGRNPDKRRAGIAERIRRLSVGIWFDGLFNQQRSREHTSTDTDPLLSSENGENKCYSKNDSVLMPRDNDESKRYSRIDPTSMSRDNDENMCYSSDRVLMSCENGDNKCYYNSRTSDPNILTMSCEKGDSKCYYYSRKTDPNVLTGSYEHGGEYSDVLLSYEDGESVSNSEDSARPIKISSLENNDGDSSSNRGAQAKGDIDDDDDDVDHSDDADNDASGSSGDNSYGDACFGDSGIKPTARRFTSSSGGMDNCTSALTDTKMMTESTTSHDTELFSSITSFPEITAGKPSESAGSKLLIGMMLVVFYVIMSFGSSLTETIALTISAPPLSWPDSWYGYLMGTYFAVGGVGSFLIVPWMGKLLRRGSVSDCVVTFLSVLCCAACSIWTGLASRFAPHARWQIFVAYAVGAQGLCSASSLRSLVSQKTPSSKSGQVMAVLSGLENLAKVLGPVLHTALLIATLQVPDAVYYTLAGEAVFALPLVGVIWFAFARS